MPQYVVLKFRIAVEVPAKEEIDVKFPQTFSTSWKESVKSHWKNVYLLTYLQNSKKFTYAYNLLGLPPNSQLTVSRPKLYL